MSQIQELHQQAMDLAEMAQVAKLRNNLDLASQLSRQAFEKERRYYYNRNINLHS
jgi:hypothetical protein